jgi:hypothetical protein
MIFLIKIIVQANYCFFLVVRWKSSWWIAKITISKLIAKKFPKYLWKWLRVSEDF